MKQVIKYIIVLLVLVVTCLAVSAGSNCANDAAECAVCGECPEACPKTHTCAYDSTEIGSPCTTYSCCSKTVSCDGDCSTVCSLCSEPHSSSHVTDPLTCVACAGDFCSATDPDNHDVVKGDLIWSGHQAAGGTLVRCDWNDGQGGDTCIGTAMHFDQVLTSIYEATCGRCSKELLSVEDSEPTGEIIVSDATCQHLD